MYIENKTHDFVRIVNNNNTHWLCVAGGLYIEDEDICLFDSLSRYSVDKNLGDQLSKFIPNSIEERPILKMRV